MSLALCFATVFAALCEPLSCGVVRVACGVRELVIRRSYQSSWPGGVAVQLAGFKRIWGCLGAVAVCLRNKTMFLSEL